MTASEAKAWFVREVLPLEAMLMHFLRQNWRNASELDDLRQEVYVRILKAADEGIPEKAKPFLFATARNLLIDRVLHERIVPFDAIADLDNLEVASDAPGPDRSAIARDELRKQEAKFRAQIEAQHAQVEAREASIAEANATLAEREIVFVRSPIVGVTSGTEPEPGVAVQDLNFLVENRSRI